MSGAFRSGWSILCACVLGLLCLHDAEAADAVRGEELCDRIVTSVFFTGNRVTRNEIIERELVQRRGDQCDFEAVLQGLQKIMDLGLFKSVQAELYVTREGLQLRYVVEEKFFFLAIPRVSRTSDGEVRLGLQLRWDNFLGRLHEVRLTSEKRQEDEGRGREGYVHSLDYTVPRFAGSRLGLAFSAGTRRQQTALSVDSVDYGEAIREADDIALQLAKWLDPSRGVGGLRVFGGLKFEERYYRMESGDRGPFRDGRDLSFVVGFEDTEIHRETYRRTGRLRGLSFRIADEALGSDFSYRRFDAWWRWYHPLPRGLKNLNTQLRIGWSDGAPFGERTYSIGGGELLRGVEPGRDSDEVLTLMNIEYLSAFVRRPEWRWAAFLDIGNVFSRSDVNLYNQNLRAGLGLRWKIVALTRTDLRVDIAWDPDTDRINPFVATDLTF